MQISISDPSQIEFFSTVEIKDLKQMVDLCLRKNFSPAVFTNGKRNLASFEAAYCIGLDIDNDERLIQGKPIPSMTIEQAKVAFKDYKHLILPSRSHQKLKDGRTCDRFRVILFFTEPITDLDTMSSTWHWCKEKWPAIDPACKDPSRFYYRHSSLVSIKEDGLLVTPVTPPPKEPSKGNIDLEALAPGDRGKLSRDTYEFLLKGTDTGNRNNTTYKVARDFAQQRYTFEETEHQILEALNRTNTITRDFPEAEALVAIRQAFKTEPKHDPRGLVPSTFNLIKLGEIYKTNLRVEWLVDKLMPIGGVSLISSEPKAGKSALIRQLALQVARGTPFLDRATKQGLVAYFAMEEQFEVINDSFKQLGARPDEPILIHAGEASSETMMEDFRKCILETKPALAIVDTLFDLITADENNYKEMKKQMRFLRNLARESRTHIILVHHNAKGDSNPRFKRRGQKGILGSVAITGGVDTIMVMDVDGQNRYLTVTGRGVVRFNNCLMKFDHRDCTYSLGQQVDEF